MKKVIELDEKCNTCGGTGLYVGFAEHDGFSVVCCRCNGTGKFHFKHEYEDFSGRQQQSPEIKRVIEYNPGIGVGTGNGKFFPEDFGGIPIKEWEQGLPFPLKSEMRKFTCPAWWYQTVNYKLKPNWKECGSGVFSSCSCFATKEKCWNRFDNQINGGKSKK